MATISITTTYLEMLDRSVHVPVPPPSEGLEVVEVEKPSIESYRSLYDAVGRDWNWVDRKLMSDEELGRIIHDDGVEVHVLYVDGTPAGYAELDRRIEGEIELAYFGLMPEFLGNGLGRYFLQWVTDHAWSYAPKRFWVHTCELDHQAALPLYRKVGFTVYDEETIDQVMPEQRRAKSPIAQV